MPIETLTDVNGREFTNVAYLDGDIFKVGDSAEITGALTVQETLLLLQLLHGQMLDLKRMWNLYRTVLLRLIKCRVLVIHSNHLVKSKLD